MSRLLLVTVLIAFFGKLASASPVFLHYTVQDGLPGNTVYDIYRDSKGYLWFGTDNGIARYNGITYELFSTAHGLPDNDLFFFKEDFDGRIWISTYSGQLCFYKDGVIYTAENTEFLRLPFKPSDTKFISVQADSSVVICFAGQGEHFVSIKHNKLSVVNTAALKVSNLEAIIKTKHDTYKVISEDGTSFINTNGRVLAHIPHPYKKYYSVNYNQDSVYIFNSQGIRSVNSQWLRPFPSIDPKKVLRFYNDKDGLFTGTVDGLFIEQTQVLKKQRISSIARDLSGNYWIGTLGNGVYKLSGNFIASHVSNHVYDRPMTNTFWLTDSLITLTDNGLLSTFNSAGGVLTKNHYININTVQPGNCSYINAGSVFILNGNLLYKYNYYDKSTFAKVLRLPANSQPKSITANDSIVYIQFSKDIVPVNYMHPGVQIHTIKGSTGYDARVYHMATDANQQAWFSVVGGLFRIVGLSAVRQNAFNGFSFKWFKFINGCFIGVTQNNKLLLANDWLNKPRIYIVNENDGNWRNAFSIDSTHILLSTTGQYRLLTLQPRNNAIPFSIKLLENAFIPAGAEHITSANGWIYFFKDGDAYAFRNDALVTQSRPPLIVSVLFRAGKQAYNTGEAIEISAGDAKNINISCSVISFDARDVFYQYKIEGKGDDWLGMQGNELNLYMSGFGSHVVKVRAVTRAGIAGAPFSVSFKVLRPFYRQVWFWLPLGLFSILGIALAVRARLKYLLFVREKEHSVKVSLIRSEYKALNALMNPHFVFNSLNSIQSLINKDNKDAANKYLALFSRLMRQNMHNLSKELIPLAEELELIRHYLILEEMRFKDRFSYKLIVDERVDADSLFIPPLLIQPLAENAIKHGLLPKEGSGSLSIRLTQTGNTLKIFIGDDGVGFTAPLHVTSATQASGSYGLINIYARIHQLNEMYDNAITLDIHSAEASGTSIIIELDIDKLSVSAARHRS